MLSPSRPKGREIFESLNHVTDATKNLPMDLISVEALKALELKRPHEIFMESRNSCNKLPKASASAFTLQSFQN